MLYMPDTLRLELRVSPEWLAALDDARGYEPRASYVKRAVLAIAVAEGAAPKVSAPVKGAASARRRVDRDAQPTELSKIAKRR